MTTEQLQKLPKWAREEFQRLERLKDRAENKLRDILDSKTKSRIWLGFQEEDRCYIQNDRVYFGVPGGEMCIHAIEEGLEVYVISQGEFVVQPRVCNVVHLKIK